jgi:hypothetical protein
MAKACYILVASIYCQRHVSPVSVSVVPPSPRTRPGMLLANLPVPALYSREEVQYIKRVVPGRPSSAATEKWREFFLVYMKINSAHSRKCFLFSFPSFFFSCLGTGGLSALRTCGLSIRYRTRLHITVHERQCTCTAEGPHM